MVFLLYRPAVLLRASSGPHPSSSPLCSSAPWVGLARRPSADPCPQACTALQHCGVAQVPCDTLPQGQRSSWAEPETPCGWGPRKCPPDEGLRLHTDSLRRSPAHKPASVKQLENTRGFLKVEWWPQSFVIWLLSFHDRH